MTGFGILLLNLFKQGAHIVTMTIGFVGTELYLLLVASQLGIALDISLFHHTERTNDAEGHLPHTQQGGHRIKASLIELIHQTGVEQVVLMMPQGNLITSQRLCQIKYLLTAIP